MHLLLGPSDWEKKHNVSKGEKQFFKSSIYRREHQGIGLTDVPFGGKHGSFLSG